MESISEFKNFNIYSSPGASAQVKSGRGAAFCTSVPAINRAPSSDVFLNPNKCLSGTQNPFKSFSGAFLCRFAPKAYLDKMMSKELIENAIQKNPEIKRILNENGVPLQINMENIKNESQNHFLTTYKKAKELSQGFSFDEKTALLQASLLHDIGKVFIPKEILNKPGKLTPEERKIIDIHADLGAEVLKTAGFNKKTIEAVRLHHKQANHPSKQNNEIAQIVSVADVYSALKEKRAYKKKFSDEDVRNIMQNDSKLNQNVVNQIFFSDDLSNVQNFAV